MLTSLPRRSPLRWMTSSSSRAAGSCRGGPGPELLHRAHDQRERGAELVADVGEERGLGPVQLGQLLGAPLLDLVGDRAVDQGGGLLGDQAEERLIGFVQRVPGAGREHDDAGGLAAGLPHQREHPGLGRRGRPPAGGQFAEPGGDVAHGHRLPAAQHLLDRPAARPGRERDGNGLMRGTGHQDRLIAAGPAQVDGGERDILPGTFQGLHHELARLGHAAGAARLRAQVLQGGEPPLADDPLGGVADRGEHPAHHAVVVVQRAVGIGPVRLFPVVVPVHRQEQVLRPGRLPAAHHRVQHRADDVPDLRPHRLARLAEGRVLGAEEREIRVVVEEPELLAPPHDHREPGREADPAGGAQARRPAAGIPHRRVGPGICARTPRHLAVPREDHVRGFGGLPTAHGAPPGRRR